MTGHSQNINAATQSPQVKTQIINPPGLYNPAPYGYSHAVVATGGSRVAYLAGQGGENEAGELSPDLSAQVKQAYKNLETLLISINAKPSQVTKITTYIVNYDQSMLEILTQHVKATFGDSLPAQTLVPVTRLALDGMLFEVDAVVVME